MSKDPNFTETDLFSFEAGPAKLKKSRSKKAEGESPKPRRTKKSIPAPAPEPEEETAAPEGETKASSLWADKYWEFDITHPSAEIKDAMKSSMVEEGFTKREANRVFKGLTFKEKVFNTKRQAKEYLKTIPTTYAVKYKIGIEPSPQMISLERRLKEKQERLASYSKEQNEKKFSADFITCPHCKSRVNTSFIHPPVCPVCGEDMRSDTAVKTIHSLEEAIKDLSKRSEDAARKHNSKFTGGERWIIRTINPVKEEE